MAVFFIFMQISLFQILLSVINLQFTEKILQYIASVNIIINPNRPVFVIFTIIHVFSDVWCLLPVIAVIMFLHHQPDHRQIADIQRFCPWPSGVHRLHDNRHHRLLHHPDGGRLDYPSRRHGKLRSQREPDGRTSRKYGGQRGGRIVIPTFLRPSLTNSAYSAALM